MQYICCICGKYHTGFGNNPEPVKYIGRCCDDCNISVVIPKRIRALYKEINHEVAKLVEANDGYCPCAIEKNADTLCPCKEFREQPSGICCCGRFEKR